MDHHCYVVMGIASCGKSSVGQELARVLARALAIDSVDYYEGDAYHPVENVEKMKNGIALDDDDRRPWLMRLHQVMVDACRSCCTCVLACSALKKIYRDVLQGDEIPDGYVRYVWLDIDPVLAKQRCLLRGTESHFFPSSLVDSQYAILDMKEEESFCHVQVHREDTVGDIVTCIMKTIMGH